MGRIATIVTKKCFKMEVVNNVENYMDDIHVYKDIWNVSSLEEIKKMTECSIQEFKWATKKCVSAYGGGKFYYHGYHYVIENPEEGMDGYKVVKILDKKDDVVCCLNIFSEEKRYLVKK